MGPARKAPDISTYSGRFAVRLRTLREKAGLTVEEVAEQIEVPAKTIYHWEIGKPTFRLDHIPALATAFGVKPRTLMPEE